MQQQQLQTALQNYLGTALAVNARRSCLVEISVVLAMPAPLHLSTLRREYIASVKAHQHNLVDIIASLSLPRRFCVNKQVLQGARRRGGPAAKRGWREKYPPPLVVCCGFSAPVCFEAGRRKSPMAIVTRRIYDFLRCIFHQLSTAEPMLPGLFVGLCLCWQASSAGRRSFFLCH